MEEPTFNNMIFKFGKFKGYSLTQMINESNYGYLQWVACQNDFKQPEIVDYIRKHVIANTRLEFGKFKLAKTLRGIKSEEPKYWKWLLEKNTGNLDFLQYV